MKSMKILGVAATVCLTGSAFAAGTGTDEATVRDLSQQQRIEQGLKSGSLSTHEAGALEQQEARIDRTEARDERDGSLSAKDKAQIAGMQNKVSGEIAADKHNAVTGNPQSASSQRMQADVQRNVNQQQRIASGAVSGSLTNREVGSLERGQAHVATKEANAAAYGGVSAREQAGIQKAENHQSSRIHRKKHNRVGK